MSFLGEIKRRKVFQVAAVYAVVAWLIIQVVGEVSEPLSLPDWLDTVVIVLLAVGFPVAIILAWAFDLTPEGVVKDRGTNTPAQKSGRKIEYVLFALLLFAVGFMFIDNYVLVEHEPAPVAATPSEEPLESGTATTVGPDRRSVAVLPFANRSINAEDAFFVDGIHDDILSQLAKIASLKVISRTSVMGYRDTDKNLRTVGEELGVATILEGGVQRAGNMVRINMQLIDAETDEHLWSEIYDRELTAENIFAIQTEMATAIADALQATLSPQEQKRLSTVPTENMAALEAYFRGKQQMTLRSSEGFVMAIDAFQQAIDLDPGFALAYVGLADINLLKIEYEGTAVEDTREIIEGYINQALALDAELGEAYTSLGHLKNKTYETEAAEDALKQALALNPNYATAYHRYAGLLFKLERFDEAEAAYRKALEFDPRSAIINQLLGFILEDLGRFEESLAQLDNVIEFAPASPLGYRAKGAYYWRVEGRLDEAVRWYRQAASIDANTPLFNYEHAQLLWDLGEDSQVECWADHTMEVAPDSFFTSAAMQIRYLLGGNETQALDSANKLLTVAEKEEHHAIRLALALLRNHDITSGDYAAARERYAMHYPELFGEATPVILRLNHKAAVDLARVLQGTDENARADMLLNNTLAYVQTIPRLGWMGYGISDVEIYALQGQTEQALTALRQAIDAGWRSEWRFYLEMNPNLDSIHEEPRFIAMVEELRADIAAQLARVRAMAPAAHICSAA